MLAFTMQFSRYGRMDRPARIGPSWSSTRLRFDRSLRTQQRAWPRVSRAPVPRPQGAVLSCRHTPRPNSQCFHIYELTDENSRLAGSLDRMSPPGQLLLRKEVIQPHLPVRLPCYDFVPIASPTFDSSLPCGLGHRLRVLPTFVT
jgi:hypothetical protein